MQWKQYKPVILQTDFFNDCSTFGRRRMGQTLHQHMTTQTYIHA